MSKELIDLRQLGSKFRSKSDLYKRMTIDRKSNSIILNIVGFFLPTFKSCSVRFSKVLAGKKKVSESRLYKLKLASSLLRLSE